MIKKSVFSKNYYIDPVAIVDISADICMVMSNADGVIREASGVINGILSLAASVPAKARCGALSDACATALAGIRNIDFWAYGQRAGACMSELCDYSDYANKSLVNDMQLNRERLQGIIAGGHSLSMLLKYTKTSDGNKMLPARIGQGVNSTDDDKDKDKKLTLEYKATKLAGLGVNEKGLPIINNATDARVYSECMTKLKNGQYTNMEIAAAVSGVPINNGIVCINNVTDAKQYMDVMDMLDKKRRLSIRGTDLLKKLELADYQLKDVAVYDDDNNLIGIKPYYVMVQNQETKMYEDDGGITIGYGHHINIKEWSNENDDDYKLLKQYVTEDIKITGITVSPEELPKSGIIVASDQMVPIEDVYEIFKSDVSENCNEIDSYIQEKNIEVSKNEFDALVIYRFNRGKLSSDAMIYLESGNKNQEDWKQIWKGGNNRKEACQKLFFEGEY